MSPLRASQDPCACPSFARGPPTAVSLTSLRPAGCGRQHHSGTHARRGHAKKRKLQRSPCACRRKSLREHLRTELNGSLTGRALRSGGIRPHGASVVHKSVRVTSHAGGMGGENWAIPSVGAGKAFDESQHASVIKALPKCV